MLAARTGDLRSDGYCIGTSGTGFSRLTFSDGYIASMLKAHTVAADIKLVCRSYDHRSRDAVTARSHIFTQFMPLFFYNAVFHQTLAISFMSYALTQTTDNTNTDSSAAWHLR